MHGDRQHIVVGKSALCMVNSALLAGVLVDLHNAATNGGGKKIIGIMGDAGDSTLAVEVHPVSETRLGVGYGEGEEGESRYYQAFAWHNL